MKAIEAVDQLPLKQRFMSVKDYHAVFKTLFQPLGLSILPADLPEGCSVRRKEFVKTICNRMVGKFLWKQGWSEVFRSWLLGERRQGLQGYESIWYVLHQVMIKADEISCWEMIFYAGIVSGYIENKLESEIEQAYASMTDAQCLEDALVSALDLVGKPCIRFDNLAEENVGDLIVLEAPGLSMVHHMAVVVPGPRAIQVSGSKASFCSKANRTSSLYRCGGERAASRLTTLMSMST